MVKEKSKVNNNDLLLISRLSGLSPLAGERSEGVGGELAGVRRAAAHGGAESGGAGGGDRHEAARRRAPRAGAGPRPGERTQPAEEEEQRAGGLRPDAGQGGLPTGRMGSWAMWTQCQMFFFMFRWYI